MKVKGIHHVAIIVNDLEKCRDFYTNFLGLEELPAFAFDYPVQFYQINETQQLHLTEWKDETSFRGHFCLEVDDFDEVFHRSKQQGLIDTAPWGKVRQLKNGAMQMFIRDPSGNLIEVTYRGAVPIDESIREDELFDTSDVFVSGRSDARGGR